MNRRTIIAIPADTHSGSSTGLLAPGDWVGLDGQTWRLSEGQRILWGQWQECWQRVRVLRKKSRLIVVHNGDAIDGVHHGTTQIITNDKEEQKRIHIDAMLKGLDIAGFKKDDLLYYTYGTESHVNSSEDSIARDFTWPNGKHLVPPALEPTAEHEYKDGRFIRDHLKIDVNGVVLDISHHGFNAGQRAWTKENSVKNVLKSIYFDRLETGLDMPRYIIRSDKHTFISADYKGRNGIIEGFITPAFQLKTHFGHKVANMKVSDIGMLIIIVEADGRTYWECPMVNFDEVEVEKV